MENLAFCVDFKLGYLKPPLPPPAKKRELLMENVAETSDVNRKVTVSFVMQSTVPCILQASFHPNLSRIYIVNMNTRLNLNWFHFHTRSCVFHVTLIEIKSWENYLGYFCNCLWTPLPPSPCWKKYIINNAFLNEKKSLAMFVLFTHGFTATFFAFSEKLT